MICYATQTGNIRNLAALRANGWRLLVSPKNGHSKVNGDFRYGVDNGAWWAYQNKQSFDSAAFERVLVKFGDRADWIVLPDIVAGGLASLAFSLSWVDRVQRHGRLMLLPVQDGMAVGDVRPHLSERVGIFIGGGTEWKLAMMAAWGELAAEIGCYLHVGRVNTERRIALCAAAGADSFDGTSASRYSINTARLSRAAGQRDLWAPRRAK